MSVELKRKIPIVIPVLNNLEYTKKAVASLVKHTNSDLFECLIVDNGSTDDTPEYLKRLVAERPDIFRSVRLEKNLGFGGGVNKGLELLSSFQWDYGIIANNDLLFTPNWLEHLLSCMESVPLKNVGIVGPMSNFAGGSQGLSTSYKNVEELDRFSTQHYEANKGKWHEAGVVVGLLMLFRRKFFDEVGYFDERFFPGTWEENDLELRGALKGWHYVVDHATFIHHYGSKTLQVTEGSKDQRKNFTTNRDRFRKKWSSAESPWEELAKERYVLRGMDPEKFKRPDGTYKKWVVGACRVKNGAAWMERVLQRQSEFCDEIVILIDQATTDNTEEICRRFPKVTLLEKETPHPYNEAQSRNQVLNMAYSRHGDWVQCFKEGHLVRTKLGYTPIEEIQKGDVVLTHSGSWYPVTKTHKNPYMGEISKIKYLGHSDPIECTPWHRFLVVEGEKCGRGLLHCVPEHTGWKYETSMGPKYSTSTVCEKNWNSYKPVWKEAKDLSKKDFVIFPLPKEKTEKLVLQFRGKIKKGNWKSIEKTTEVTPELCRLFGLYLAEGFFSANNGTINFCFHEKETEFHQFVLQTMKSIFGLSGRIKKCKNSRAVVVSFTGRWLGEEFVKLFGHGAENKRIPEEFLSLSYECKEALFTGWAQGDGNWQGTYYQVTSVSPNLAFKMRELLWTLKIPATLRTKKAGYYEINKGKISPTRKAYIVAVGGPYLKKLAQLTKHQEYSNNIDFERHKTATFFFQENEVDFIAFGIQNIESEKFNGTVYNLSVAVDNTYTVNQVVTHNCFDADEMPEKRACDNRDELTDPVDPAICLWVQPIVQLWNTERTQRVDGVWGHFYQGRMFRVLPGQKIDNQNNLVHSGSTPYFPPDRHGFSYHKIIHFGNVDSSNRSQKYEWYTKTDTDKDLNMALGGQKDYYWRLYYGQPNPQEVQEFSGLWKVLPDDTEWKRPSYGYFYNRDVYRHVMDERGVQLVPYDENQTISLCMLAHNEAGYIPKVVQSIRPFLSELIVIDTGSTDGSDSVAEQMGAKVYQFEWKDDFSAARNFALSKSTCKWILRLDPDEVAPWETAIRLPELVRDGKMEGYVFPIINWLQDPQGTPNAQWALSETCRLYKNLYPTVQYKGLVHEELDDTLKDLSHQRIAELLKNGVKPEDAKEQGKIQIGKVPWHIFHNGYLRGKPFLDHKFDYYYKLGLKQIEENKDDYRPYFTTAVHNLHCGRYREALEGYQRVLELDPRHHMALNDCGVIYLTVLNDCEKAEYHFKKALECMNESTHPEHRRKVEKNLEEAKLRILTRVLAVV